MKNKNLLSYIVTAVFIIAVIGLILSGDGKSNNESGTASVVSSISFDDAVGKEAPDFSLQGFDGKTVKLSDLKGKNVVLFFNEGEMCYPACWDQIKSLAVDARFNTADTAAFSIVIDTADQWKTISEQDSAYKNAQILFDTDLVASNAYGVLNLPSSMHPKRYPGHTYILIDKAGVIRFTFDDPNMANNNDKLVEQIGELNKK